LAPNHQALREPFIIGLKVNRSSAGLTSFNLRQYRVEATRQGLSRAAPLPRRGNLYAAGTVQRYIPSPRSTRRALDDISMKSGSTFCVAQRPSSGPLRFEGSCLITGLSCRRQKNLIPRSIATVLSRDRIRSSTPLLCAISDAERIVNNNSARGPFVKFQAAIKDG
jgi:hypothetical protein